MAKKQIESAAKKVLAPASKQVIAKTGRDKDPANEQINHLAEVKLTDDFVQDIDLEQEAMKKMLRDADKKFADTFGANNDTEYWFVVSFQDRRQKDFFLQWLGWDVYGDKYLNGLRVAAWEKIDLPAPLGKEETPRPKKRFAELVDESLDDLPPLDGEPGKKAT
jgi:hypothetical protein